MIFYSKKKVSLYAYLFFVSLFFICPTIYAQYNDFSQTTENAYQNVLKLRLEKATEEIKESDLPSDLYVKQLASTIKMLLEEDRTSLNEYEKSNDSAYGQIKKGSSDNPQQKFYLAELLLQSAFVHLKHGEEFSAAWEIRKAYRTIKKNVELYPEFIPHYKTIGLLHVMIGLIPDKYNWIVSLMGMEGTISQGIGELEQLAKTSNTFSEEARVLIPFIQSYVFQNTQSAVGQFEELYQAHSDNLLYHYLYALLLTKNSQSEDALTIVEAALLLENTSGYSSLSALKYLKAEILLQKGEYTQSLMLYHGFIDEHKGSNFVKDSYYKMGLVHWLNDNEESARDFFAIALEIGTTNTEADKYAESQLEEELPNREILKLRFATDGGYYNLAESVVSDDRSLKLDSKKEEVEFTYRKARYYHKTGKTQPATAFYKLTIETSKDHRWYFAPNAALQLGYIYQSSGEKELATKYFEKALSYKNHQYKTSIDNKAKSALETYNAL